MDRYKTALACLALVLAVGRLHAQGWKTVSPPARCAARMVFDSTNSRVILFGGTSVYADGRYYYDVWQMLTGTGEYSGWLPLRPSGTPPAGRADFAMVVDHPGNRAIIFGGSPGFGLRVNDLWALNLEPGSESWERLAPSGSPPSARAYPFAAFHPGRRSLVVFGGEANSGVLNDVWELRLDSLEWRHIAVSGQRPSARCDGGAVLDAVRDRLVIYGGKAGSHFYSDLWELDLTPGSELWTALAPGGEDPQSLAGFAHAQTYDGSKLVVFGGWNPYYRANLYVLDVPGLSWSRIVPGGEPPQARRNTCGVWDSRNGSFLVFGGECDRGLYLSDASYVEPFSTGTAGPRWQDEAGPGPALFLVSVAARTLDISYLLPGSEPARLDIVDLTGRLVREFDLGNPGSPTGLLRWDGTDARGARAAAGVYFCRLAAGTMTLTRRFTLVD